MSIIETLVKHNLGLFERIFLFNDLLPQIKIVVVMSFILSIVIGLVFYLFFTLEFPDMNKKTLKGLSLGLIFIGFVFTYFQLPSTNYEKIYPSILDNQVIQISQDNEYLLDVKSNKMFKIVEGRLMRISE